MTPALSSAAQQQIIECSTLLTKLFGTDICGVYLYGSAIIGGLQKYSDLDLFVVLNRPTTQEEKAALTKKLLTISGIYMKDTKPPIEMTIVTKSAINPWQYPPLFDFQYGEWLRDEFEKGIIASPPTQQMPDLAILITQILAASKTISGDEAHTVLCPVPRRDVIAALTAGVPERINDLATDTRNVLLTLARTWCTVATNTIVSKPAAAKWALARTPQSLQLALQRAKDICEGKTEEHWGDIEAHIEPCARYMKKQIDTALGTENHHTAIKVVS